MLQASAWSLPATRPCTPAEVAELIQPASTPYRLTCRARLEGQAVTRRVLFEGAESSGAGLDCGGGALGVPRRATTTREPTIAIWSRRLNPSGEHWSRPTDIRIENCVVHGNIRIWGMGAGGSMSDLLASSRTADHTARTQAAAPSHIALEGLTLAATGSIPLYIGPGVTAVTVQDVNFAGRSASVALYLDAESADNQVLNSRFDVRTGREQIAVDGSARNRIVGNRFAQVGRGGVFLYRNCGEDGVIRHQTPSHNHITDNVFAGLSLLRPRAVVVGAREGNRRYCGDDRGYPFGSSQDDGDGATGNLVARNRVVR